MLSLLLYPSPQLLALPSSKKHSELSKIHLPSFRHDLLNSSIFVDPQTTLLTLNTQIHDCLIALLDKHAPLITKFCPNRQTKPFITPTILAAKKTPFSFGNNIPPHQAAC